MSTRVTSSATAPITSLVSRWEDDRLFAAAEAMERLASNTDFGVVVTLVTEGRENAQSRLIHGPTLEQEGYTRALGFLSGLDVVREIPRVIREAAEKRQVALERQSDERAEAGGR